MLSRRSFLAGSAVSLASPRPNVLVFMTDQESALLPGPVNLPARRRIEQQAVRFDHAFCNTPQCSPARSALLTGLEPHHTGVLTNVDAGSLGKPLPESLDTVGSIFEAAGYSTGYFGKWHLGGAHRGFRHFAEGRDEAAARQAADWIRRQREPWLAWVSVINPHDIYGIPKIVRDTPVRPGVQPPSSDLRNLVRKPSEQQEYTDHDQGTATKAFTPDQWVRYRSHYCSLVEKADACLGVVLDAIQNLDATIVACTSDHGDALGEHGLPFKGPFMYEELIRIPLLISAPGAFSRERRRDDLVTQADLGPTLAGLAGVPWTAKTDGLDLTRSRGKRDAVFLEYYAKQKWVNPIRTIRTRSWKLNWYDRDSRELYELSRDPHELVNRAAIDPPRQVLKELEAKLNAWRPKFV